MRVVSLLWRCFVVLLFAEVFEFLLFFEVGAAGVFVFFDLAVCFGDFLAGGVGTEGEPRKEFEVVDFDVVGEVSSVPHFV